MFIRFKHLLLAVLGLFIGACAYGWYQVRHHKLSFLAGRGLMCVNVAKSLLQNDKRILASTVSRKKILAHYVAIEKQSLMDSGVRTSETMSAKFLNYQITFFTYNALLSLLREIFVHEEYAIKLDGTSPVIIDCGSNIGISILFFKTVYPHAQVLGFEADAANYAVLEKNMADNKIAQVQLVNKAVSDHDGVISFNRISTLCAKIEEGAATQVPCVRLSSYILGPVDLLKMDIEGAEVSVLDDLSKTNKLKFIKQIVFEFHYNIHDNNHLAHVLTMLEDHGFNYQIGTSREWRLHFDKSSDQQLKDRCLMIYAYQHEE